MLNLYTYTTQTQESAGSLTKGEELSVYYHSVFDFPLSIADLIRWKANDTLNIATGGKPIVQKSGYFYIEGTEGLIFKRIMRKRISAKKLAIAKKAAKLLSVLPSLKFVGVTGSLAMENSNSDGDIDLMIITSKNLLWTTRIMVYGLLKAFNIKVRSPKNKNEKDRLCLNIWLDESALTWAKRDRNIYTAHEIAQVLPLINKAGTFEKFLFKNKWILNYWPHSVKIRRRSSFLIYKNTNIFLKLVEKIAYGIQLNYMKPKMTREVVGSSKGLFHPLDWGGVVEKRLAA